MYICLHVKQPVILVSFRQATILFHGLLKVLK